MLRTGALTIVALILGSAPALAEPKPVDEACAYKGPGFVSVPGTATCVRVAGRTVAEADAGPRGTRTRTRTGGTVSMDVRTDSELGPVRGFVRLRVGEGDARGR